MTVVSDFDDILDDLKDLKLFIQKMKYDFRYIIRVIQKNKSKFFKKIKFELSSILANFSAPQKIKKYFLFKYVN